jgi:hypothetical protein
LQSTCLLEDMALPFQRKQMQKKIQKQYSTLQKNPNKGFVRLAKEFNRITSQNVASPQSPFQLNKYTQLLVS